MLTLFGCVDVVESDDVCALARAGAGIHIIIAETKQSDLAVDWLCKCCLSEEWGVKPYRSTRLACSDVRNGVVSFLIAICMYVYVCVYVSYVCLYVCM